jgi:hypothetical protein
MWIVLDGRRHGFCLAGTERRPADLIEERPPGAVQPYGDNERALTIIKGGPCELPLLSYD